MEKNNKSLKDFFQFLEKLFNYHHNSAVVTAVFRERVKLLGMIIVNGTRWISHVQLASKKPP